MKYENGIYENDSVDTNLVVSSYLDIGKMIKCYLSAPFFTATTALRPVSNSSLNINDYTANSISDFLFQEYPVNLKLSYGDQVYYYNGTTGEFSNANREPISWSEFDNSKTYTVSFDISESDEAYIDLYYSFQTSVSSIPASRLPANLFFNKIAECSNDENKTFYYNFFIYAGTMKTTPPTSIDQFNTVNHTNATLIHSTIKTQFVADTTSKVYFYFDENSDVFLIYFYDENNWSDARFTIGTVEFAGISIYFQPRENPNDILYVSSEQTGMGCTLTTIDDTIVFYIRFSKQGLLDYISNYNLYGFNIYFDGFYSPKL